MKQAIPAIQAAAALKRQELARQLGKGQQCQLCNNAGTVFTWSREVKGAEFAFRCPEPNCRAVKVLNPSYPVWDDEKHGMHFYMRSWMGDSGAHSNRPAFETNRPTGQKASPERVKEVFAHLRKTLGLDVMKEAIAAERIEIAEASAHDF